MGGMAAWQNGLTEEEQMRLEGEGKLLRIFIGEADRVGHAPLSDVLVRKAREMGLAGATVIRGIQGYGARSRLHTAKILRLSEDLHLSDEASLR